MEDPGLLPLGPTARMLRVPTKWLRDEALSGRLPHLNAGGKLLFNLTAVTAELLARAGQQQPKEEASAHAR